MIKVFLVEDEVIIRKGIRRNISWEAEGFVFAGEASDGELAWPMIRKCRPDILITDIRMPFMDGLELAGLVRKELPDIKIIILSGYSEFDYAKQAISLGVTEYLLKPVSSEKLLEVVKRVADVIRKEREHKELVNQYKKEMEENIDLEKKRLFDRLVICGDSMMALLEQGQALGLDLASPFYTVLLFKLMTSEENQEYSAELVAVSERVHEIMNRQELLFERGAEGWAILLKTDSDEEVPQELEGLEKKIRGLLEEYPGIRYFGGIGETVQRMRDISVSYQSASKAFAGRFFAECNQFVRVGQIEGLKRAADQDMSLESVDASKIDRRLVENFLKSGVEEEVNDFVEEYFKNVGQKNYRSVMFCHYIIVDMNFCVSSFLADMGMDISQLPARCREIDQLSYYASSPEGMLEYVKLLLTETIRLRDRSARNRYHDMIEEAKKGILNHFQNNEFSLNQAAAMVNISPGYFSTLFRQETGKTFIEYLTEVRLEKAKALLMCTDMRSSEIGYQVGYKDAHYFSYIFKKACGCTPKEYRMRKGEGQP